MEQEGMIPGKRGINGCDRYEYPLSLFMPCSEDPHVDQTFSGLGKLVANEFLKFPRGTNLSSYAQLYIGFFLSGLLHCSGDFMIEKRVVYRSFNFFFLQAVAITFEDFVIYIAKGLLRRRRVELNTGKDDESWAGAVVRVVGYCWVTLWFCLSLPVWVDGLSAAGFGSLNRGPIVQFVLDTMGLTYIPYIFPLSCRPGFTLLIGDTFSDK